MPVQLSEHAVPFCSPLATNRDVHHLDVRFVAVVPEGAEPVSSEESLHVRWWPYDALPDEELAELVALARERLAQSTSSPGGGSTRAAADQPSR